MNAITLKNISKRFDNPHEKQVEALENINLEIKEGEFFIFVGPSGSGKSTLLRIMSGLEKSFSGEVLFGEGFSRDQVSFVFQQFALWPWLTIYQNLELGLIAQGLNKRERDEKIIGELRKFGLEKFAESYPRELSGGQRQRVGLARALVVNPKIIFMDEPFSELDSFTAQELRGEVLNIWQERRPTIVMVTHIVEDAIELADRIAVLTPSPGRLEKVIENNLPRPRGKRSESFYNLEDNLYRLIKP